MPSRSLLGISRNFRKILGRKVYLLVCLMPLATLAEGFGITLLLPLLSKLEDESVMAGESNESIQRFLTWLPLPNSALALLLLIACAFFLKAVFKFSTESFFAFLHARLIFRLKTTLLDAYTHLNFSAFSKRNSGHYINVINIQTSRNARAFHSLVQLLMQVAAAGVYLSIAALVNWQFAILAAVVGAIFMLTLKTLSTYVRKLSRKTAQEQSVLSKQLVQVLHAHKYLLATNRTQTLSNRVVESCRRLFRFELTTHIAGAVTLSAREPLSIIIILSLTAVQIHYFRQPLVLIFVALLLLHRTTNALFAIQSGWQKMMEMIGSAEMIQEELEFSTRNREVPGDQKLVSFEETVKFQNVSFAYDPTDGDVLHNITLAIPRNQTVALVGHSGAGKSTVADLLTLLHRPRSGSIHIDGQDTRNLDPRTWRSRIGYVCQETVVFDETIAANICLSNDSYHDDPEYQRRIQEAAEQAFASEFIESLPNAYKTVVGDRGIRLSGGQRQRLFIARELYKEPDLLILDEATSALDGASERAIQNSIDALRGQLTVLVIAHRLATIKNADLIYVLQDGRIIEQGPYKDLHSDDDSTFRRMVELQTL